MINGERSRKGTALPHISWRSRFASTDLNWPRFQAQRLADRMSVTILERGSTKNRSPSKT